MAAVDPLPVYTDPGLETLPSNARVVGEGDWQGYMARLHGDPFGPENWFGEASQKALVDLYGKVAHLNGEIIEVGSWTGRSTVALANAAHPEIVIAVDTWEGSPGEVSQALAAQRDVYATFRANIETLTAGNVEDYRTDWRNYFDASDQPVKFCFIDAEHSYTEVRDNIAAVRPLLVPGGIVCGDDVHHPPVQRAVLEAFPDAQDTATLWWWQSPDGTLSDAYGRLCRTPSDIYEHLPAFVRLVEERNAQHVVELGTRTGVSTTAWLYALERNGGRLTSIDTDPKPDIGDWPHWTFIQGDDLDPTILASLEDADIVFIDTSHTYEQTARELRVYRHLVKPGGLIVCHDTELRRPIGAPPRPQYPVRAAIEEFVSDEGLQWVNHTNCWGLGIITMGG